MALGTDAMALGTDATSSYLLINDTAILIRAAADFISTFSNETSGCCS
ncbi:MAG: hypothetical protein WCL14_04445 [Bacteroidota bacterium]